MFADISNVNLYDGEQVIQPEDLELLPQEMHYKGSEGKPAKVMADVRMRRRNYGLTLMSNVCGRVLHRDERTKSNLGRFPKLGKTTVENSTPSRRRNFGDILSLS